MMPAAPVAKATEPTPRNLPGGEPLRHPEQARLSTFAGRPLTGLAGRSDEEAGDAPVFYRPSPGSARGANGVSGEPVCDDLEDFPEGSRAVFPLPKDYFDSYEDTWGAPRPQGGHEGADLMSPTGTSEFAITDGTVVPVSGANKNGWNRLGGYTVMLEAAYDIGPIKKGDLFYYAHMDRESALPIGTKVRAGQRIGSVGDTGEGSEATRGNFPPHLHLGWYDTGSADDRSDLESGAMNPYPLLVWLEENGGAVSGGKDVLYCEAPREPFPEPSTGEDSWPAPELPGTRPDLDTGSAYDARPSPAVEEGRQRHYRSSERESGSDEGNGSSVFGGRIGPASGDSGAAPSGGSERDDGAEEDRGGTPAQHEDEPAASEDRTSRSLVGGASLEAKTREKGRSLSTEPFARPDRASRPSYVSILADVLRKKMMKEDRVAQNAGKKDRDGKERGKGHDGRDASVQDKKKQKKPANQPGPGEFQEKRSAPETDAAPERSQPVSNKKDTDESSVPEEERGASPKPSGETTAPVTGAVGRDLRGSAQQKQKAES
jgi:murein DD-endopeptidase MepM/ murein hydrolase activator NlpD